MGDWDSAQYITSQFFILAAFALQAITYFVTRRGKQLSTMILSNMCMGIGYALLGGWIGVYMHIIAITRDVTSNIINNRRAPVDKNKTTRLDWWLLALWIGLLTITSVFTANGFVSLFTYFATVTFTISIWQKNVFIYRLLGIFVGIFSIIYQAFLQSFVGTTLASVMLVFVIIGFIKYLCDYKITKTSN